MNHNTFRIRLQHALARGGEDVRAIGIDLGTTKSSVAIARYSMYEKALECICVKLGGTHGETGIALPSAVAIDQDRVMVGAEALARRGQPGFLPERNFFFETKNIIGLKYTYPNPRYGFANASDIAEHILRHLLERVDGARGTMPRTPPAVGCPASYHAAQRRETLNAVTRAFDSLTPVLDGPDQLPLLERSSGLVDAPAGLIDEPYAAFIDLLFREPEGSVDLLQSGKTLMVFDFGGGTCDVAIFRIAVTADDPIGARLLATSRYHRLGGGDIDRAIVHEVLIPQVIAENGLDPWELSWHDKSRQLEPALIETAEILKLRMSQKLAGQGGRGANLTATEPAAVTLPELCVEVKLGGVLRTITLKQPRLDTSALLTLLKPFLDPDPAPESGDEYVQRSSIFSPVKQALARAGLEQDDIDGVLLCGCSSLLPPVQTAIRTHFPNANCVLIGQSDEALQGAVARGAALQALARNALGRNLIEPVCTSELTLSVTSGRVPLVRAGDRLPARCHAAIVLHPPRDSNNEDVTVGIEILADGKWLVGRALWVLPAPVSAKDELNLHWFLDENQCLELELQRDSERLMKQFDSPVAHHDLSHVVRCRMLERMEAIRSGNLPRAELGYVCEKIARDAGALGEYERALHFVSVALQEEGEDGHLLNLRGIYRQRLGNKDGALEAYLKASEYWVGARFNLSLMHHRAGLQAEALQEIDLAMDIEPNRAYRVLRGDILDALGRNVEARREWQDALSGKIDFDALEQFDLGWLDGCAQKIKREKVRQKIRATRNARAQDAVNASRQGELPVYARQIVGDASEPV